MIAFSRPYYDTGVRIQITGLPHSGKSRHLKARRLFDFLNRYGGPERIKEVMQEGAQHPDKWQIYRTSGTSGGPERKPRGYVGKIQGHQDFTQHARPDNRGDSHGASFLGE